MAAEVDGLMQNRAVETSHKALAEEVARQMAAQAVATPAQQIIKEHFHHIIHQPVPLPTPAVPMLTSQSKRTGASIHEIFIAAHEPAVARTSRCGMPNRK